MHKNQFHTNTHTFLIFQITNQVFKAHIIFKKEMEKAISKDPVLEKKEKENAVLGHLGLQNENTQM